MKLWVGMLLIGAFIASSTVLPSWADTEAQKQAETTKPDVQANTEKSDDGWNAWATDCATRIWRQWYPPKFTEGPVPTDVKFSVLSNGEAVDSFVTKPSGVKIYDESCLAAIKKASPFVPLSESLKKIDVDANFPYIGPVTVTVVGNGNKYIGVGNRPKPNPGKYRKF